MIHLDPVTEFLVFDLRVYPGDRDPDLDFRTRKPFKDGSARVNWYPLESRASIHRLLVNGMKFTDYIDIAEAVFRKTGATVVQWERASGKQMEKLRIGPRTWVDTRRAA